MARRARTLSGPSGALLFAAALFSGCGGADRGRPQANGNLDTDAGVVDPCRAADGLEFQSITTFDPPTGATRTLDNTLCDRAVNSSGTGCTYFNYDNIQSPGSCGVAVKKMCLQANLQPNSDSVCLDLPNLTASSSVPVTQIPGRRCDVSSYAFHLAGKNIATCYDPEAQKQGWGSSLQFTFNADPGNSGKSTAPVDATAWDGISFWAHRGPGAVGNSLLVSAADGYSGVPPAPLNMTAPNYCDYSDPMGGAVPPDATKCDPFGAGVLLTTEWRFITLPFDKLKQKGFGKPSPLGHLDVAAVTGIKLGISAGDWDVWIDDLAFYRKPK